MSAGVSLFRRKVLGRSDLNTTDTRWNGDKQVGIFEWLITHLYEIHDIIRWDLENDVQSTVERAAEETRVNLLVEIGMRNEWMRTRRRRVSPGLREAHSHQTVNVLVRIELNRLERMSSEWIWEKRGDEPKFQQAGQGMGRDEPKFEVQGMTKIKNQGSDCADNGRIIIRSRYYSGGYPAEIRNPTTRSRKPSQAQAKFVGLLPSSKFPDRLSPWFGIGRLPSGVS